MNNREIQRLNLKKNWRGYEAFLILITVLEGLMMIYGFLHFDFQDLRRKLYFSSYAFLFCYTIITIIVNRIYIKRDNFNHAAIHNVYLYNAVLIFWSALISALDITGGGYPVTYMTILAAVGSVTSLPPLLYACIAIFSSASMITIVMYVGNDALGFPFFLNYAIFLIVVIAVEIRNYSSTRNQYMLGKRLEELAGIDSLTQIANRRSLDTYMAQLMQERSLFTFALLDVDNFKSINDTYGHLEGDLSLEHIARILTEIFGEHVFRYGGDEFAVISFEESESVAKKLNLVNLKLKERKTEYILQICSGVYHNEQQDDERRIFELADLALYEAKHNGKARSVIYNASLCTNT